MPDRTSLADRLRDVDGGVRFLASLPGYLRRPVDLATAEAAVRRRLAGRQLDFIDLCQRAIYDRPASPYRRLLALAGCEPGDLRALTERQGVEGALGELFRRGVYLTVDELKGRRPAVRGSASLRVEPGALRNPRTADHFLNQSGGSRGVRAPVPLDLAFIRDFAVNRRLVVEARGCAGGPFAFWHVPGGEALVNVLEPSAFGIPPERWFSSLDPATASLHPRYRWSARALRLGGWLAGRRLPRPEVVPPDRPLPIARWLAAALRAGRTPHLGTPTSSAIRLCQAALEAGLDLRGARLSVGGEPLTEARRAVLERAGVQAATSYGTAEAGRIGHGCLRGEAADDLHVFDDLVALIQPGPDGSGAGLPPRALLVTSLRATAPLILLNVSLGDQADLVRRRCGCPLEGYGWPTHLRAVRSFEKLSADGMTFLDADVVRVLEEVLPGRFGGGPTDYQLVEDEADDGRPRLRLLVHPRVGPLDEAALREAFLAAIGPGSGADRVMALHWRQSRLLTVERRPPLTTGAGKVLHLYRTGSAPGP